MTIKRKAGRVRDIQFSFISRKKGWTNDYVKNPPTYLERCEIAWLMNKPEPMQGEYDNI
jgi:hypothetical protein